MLNLSLISDPESLATFFNFYNQKKKSIEKNIGQKLKIKYIYNFSAAEVDKRFSNLAEITNKYNKILTDPDIKIIIELSSSNNSLLNLKQALKNKKNFISCNKKIITENYSIIKSLEQQYQKKVYFSAAFSPLPLQTLIENFYKFDELKELNAVLNSTANFILTEMGKNTISMKETIEKAKKSSYMEKNPNLDLDGWDSLYKIVLFLNIFYNSSFSFTNIEQKSIKGITSYDLIYAAELGYKIKLMTTIKKKKANFYLGIRPKLLPEDGFLASVNGNANAVEIFSEFNSRTVFKAENSDSTVMNFLCLDLIKAAKNINSKQISTDFEEKNIELNDLYQNSKESFYIRLQLTKNEEIIEKIKNIFSEKNLAELILHDNLTETPLLPVIIISKQIEEKKLKEILKEVEDLEGVLTVNNIIPIKGK